MAGSFHGINLASSALRAFQRAMETSGNNLANVNTRGYSRQRVNLQAADPMSLWSKGQFQLGAGVRIDSITRARELFLEGRFHSSNSDASRYFSHADGLRQVEGIYREPGEMGISSALGKVFDSWSGLSANPNDPNARLQVRNAASQLASRIRGAYSELGGLRDQSMQVIQSGLQQVDSITSQIATLNSQIRASQATGGVANSLLDQRDVLMRDLSELVNVTSSLQSDGTLNVYVSNLPVVIGDLAKPMPTDFDPIAQTVTDGTTTFPIRGGKILGEMMTVARIDRARSELDTLANNLRSQFNALHQTGTNALGGTGLNFFNDVTPPAVQTGASNFDLDPAILADPNAIASGTSGAAGDGGLALAISQLRSQKIAGLGDKTLQEYYSMSVSNIATDIGFFQAQGETFGAVLDQIAAQAESISGVNIDEEMTDLLRFQRSYQASARVLTIMDQVTEDIINMVRR